MDRIRPQLSGTLRRAVWRARWPRCRVVRGVGALGRSPAGMPWWKEGLFSSVRVLLPESSTAFCHQRRLSCSDFDRSPGPLLGPGCFASVDPSRVGLGSLRAFDSGKYIVRLFLARVYFWFLAGFSYAFWASLWSNDGVCLCKSGRRSCFQRVGCRRTCRVRQPFAGGT